MKFLRLRGTDPYYNLAVEEYLFRNSNDDIFMLWQNEPTVVIGKNQNAYAEIKMELAEACGVHIARRITGGGAVYHDLGNVNYTFISSANEKEGIDFEFFTRPMIEALAALGVKAELSGRNDLLSDGRKFSGNAQYSFCGRTLHHGTLLFDSDLDFLTSVLNVDEEKIRSKAIKSTRSRVINIRELIGSVTDADGFMTLLEGVIRERYGAESLVLEDTSKIEELRQRNCSQEWLFPEKSLLSSYSVLKKKRYPFGIVEIYLDMINNDIRDIKIRGDFFGICDVSELEGIIRGARLNTLSEKLCGIELGDYILGMTAELFEEHIKK